MMRSRRRMCMLLCVGLTASLLLLSQHVTFSTDKGLFSTQFTRKRVTEGYISTRPDTSIVYIKSERTAGCTISTIFKSYGLVNHLNMLLSTVKESDTSLNTREMESGLSWNIAPDPNASLQLSMLGTRYNKPFFDTHFPRDTIYIASIREPEQWILSYTHNKRSLRDKDYTAQKMLHYDWMFQLEKRWISQMDQFVHNNFLQWFGYSMHQYYQYNETEVLSYIKFIDQQFALVMISDYFYESLVLMRRLLNWSMTDIFFTHLNKSKRKLPPEPLTDEERQKLFDLNHNRGDWLLYQHFNTTFWEKISRQLDFYEEVEQFKRYNELVTEFCRTRSLLDHTATLHLPSKFDSKIFITAQRCLALRSSSVHSTTSEELEKALDVYAPFRRTVSVERLRLDKYLDKQWPS